MKSQKEMKTPCIKLTPEIIVSPRLYRFLEHSAANLGGSVEYLLYEEARLHIEALRVDRHKEMRAAAHGMSYREYQEYESQLADERMAAMQV